MRVFKTELIDEYCVGKPFVRYIRAASAAEAAWAARGWITPGGYKDALVVNERDAGVCEVAVSEWDGTGSQRWSVREYGDGTGRAGNGGSEHRFGTAAASVKKYDTFLRAQTLSEDPTAGLWSSVRAKSPAYAADAVAGLLAGTHYSPLEGAYVDRCLVDVYESGTRAGGQTWEIIYADGVQTARRYVPQSTGETPMTGTGQPSAADKKLSVSSAVSSSSGACIAYADADNKLCFRDRVSDSVLKTGIDLGDGPSLVFSGDGQYVASLSRNRLAVVTVKGKVEFNREIYGGKPGGVAVNWDATRIAARVRDTVFLFSLSGRVLAHMPLNAYDRVFGMQFYDSDGVAILVADMNGVPTELRLKPDPEQKKPEGVPVKAVKTEADTVDPFAEVVCGAAEAPAHCVYFDESNGIAVFRPDGVSGPIVLTNPTTRKTLKLGCLPNEVASSGSFIRGTNTFAATVNCTDKPYERVVRYWKIPQSFLD